MMEFRTKSAFGAPSGGDDWSGPPGHFSRHDRAKEALSRLISEHGRAKVESTLEAILTDRSVDPLEDALRKLVDTFGEGMVHSELSLLDPKNVSTRSPLRQRSWGPMNSADEIARMRGRNVDIRA